MGLLLPPTSGGSGKEGGPTVEEEWGATTVVLGELRPGQEGEVIPRP